MIWPIIEQILEQINTELVVVNSLESDKTVPPSVNENEKNTATEAPPDSRTSKPTQSNTMIFSDSKKKAAVKPVPTKDAKRDLETSFVSCSNLHSYYYCHEKHCTNITKTEYERIKSITRDKFQHYWIFDKELSYCKKTGFYWLVFEEGNGMFCLFCRKHDTWNSQNKAKKFNLDASVRYKRKSVEDHANSDQHLAAVEAELMNRVSTFQKQIDKREEIKEDMYHNVFLSLYWIAKEELPNCKFVRLIELLRLLKLSDIQYFEHKSAGSVRQMFLILGETIRDHVRQKVSDSFFSILCDEVCDTSNKEQLISFIQYADQHSGKPDVKFLAMDDLHYRFRPAKHHGSRL